MASSHVSRTNRPNPQGQSRKFSWCVCFLFSPRLIAQFDGLLLQQHCGRSPGSGYGRFTATVARDTNDQRRRMLCRRAKIKRVRRAPEVDGHQGRK
jgi:hypothetical protein